MIGCYKGNTPLKGKRYIGRAGRHLALWEGWSEEAGASGGLGHGAAFLADAVMGCVDRRQLVVGDVDEVLRQPLGDQPVGVMVADELPVRRP